MTMTIKQLSDLLHHAMVHDGVTEDTIILINPIDTDDGWPIVATEWIHDDMDFGTSFLLQYKEEIQ